MENGLQLNTWRDWASFAAVLGVVLGVIGWGLKLDDRIDQHEKISALKFQQQSAKIATNQATMSPLILPIAAKEITDLKRRINDLEDRVNGKQ